LPRSGGSTISSNSDGAGNLRTCSPSSLKNSSSAGLPSTTCSNMWMTVPSSSLPSASTGTLLTTGAFPADRLSISIPPSESMVRTTAFLKRGTSSSLPGNSASRTRSNNARSSDVGSRNPVSSFGRITYVCLQYQADSIPTSVRRSYETNSRDQYATCPVSRLHGQLLTINAYGCSRKKDF